MADQKPAGGATPAQLESAWRNRLEESKSFHESGRFPMSIALGYYSLEILLKFRICRLLDVDELPRPLHTHDVNQLLQFSGLQRRLLGDTLIRRRWGKIVAFRGRIDHLRYGQEEPTKLDSIKFHRALWANPAERWTASTYGVIPWITRQA